MTQLTVSCQLSANEVKIHKNFNTQLSLVFDMCVPHKPSLDLHRSACQDPESYQEELLEATKKGDEIPVEKAKPETPRTEKCKRESPKDTAKRPAVTSNLYNVPGEHFQRAVYRMDDGERSERCTKGDLPPMARREKVKTRGTPFKHLSSGAKASRAGTASKSPERDTSKGKGGRSDGQDRGRTKGSRIDERDGSKSKGGRGEERDRSKAKCPKTEVRESSSVSEENGRKEKEERESAKIGRHQPRVPRSRHRFKHKGSGDFAKHQRKEADNPQGGDSKDKTLTLDGKTGPGDTGSQPGQGSAGGAGDGGLPMERTRVGAGMEGVEDTRHFDLLPVAVLMKSKQTPDEGDYGPGRARYGKQKSGKNKKRLA